jgi:hypothetical protein
MADQTPFQVTEAFIYQEVKLPLSRPQPVDIGPAIVEINLYEALNKPYTTGTVLIVDDFGYLNAFMPKGTERLKLIISKDGRSKIDRTFVIDSIQQINYENEQRRILTLSICDESIYYSNLKTVEKAYTAPLWVTMASILKDYLGVTALPFWSESRTNDVDTKVIIPGMRPLRAVDWLRDRLTTSKGLPCFTYKRSGSGVVVITDLEHMLQQTAITSNTGPLEFTRVAQTVDEADRVLDIDNQVAQIYDANLTNLQSNMAAAQHGGLSGVHTHIDTNNGTAKETEFSLRNVEISGQNIINTDIFEYFSGDDRERPSHYDQVSSSGTYIDEYGFYDPTDNGDIHRRTISKGLNAAITRNSIKLIIPGALFLNEGHGVGDKIQVKFPTSRSGDEFAHRNPADAWDKVLSGDYIASEIKHVFNIQTGHSAHVNMFKVMSYDGGSR